MAKSGQRIVMKFGGTSRAGTERIRRVANIVRAQAAGGIVAVLIAQRRHDNAELGSPVVHAFGDFVGGLQGLGADCKTAGVFLRCCQPGIWRGNIGRGQTRKGRVAVNRP